MQGSFPAQTDSSFEALKAAARMGVLELVAWGHGTYPGREFEPHMVPQVQSVGRWNATRKHPWSANWQLHRGVMFLWVERGKLSLQVGSEVSHLHTSGFAVLSPGLVHRLAHPLLEPSVVHWLLLDLQDPQAAAWQWPAWMMALPEDLERVQHLVQKGLFVTGRGNPELGRCFSRIHGTLLLPEAEQVTARLKLHINELLMATLEWLNQQEQGPVVQPGSYRAVAEFLEHLDHHLDQPWTLSSMAEACGLGRTQFSRYCLQVTNLTPMDHLHLRRLERARVLLEQGDHSITEISCQCGFNSSQYFANSFRAHLGCSPSEYRKRHLLKVQGSGISLG